MPIKYLHGALFGLLLTFQAAASPLLAVDLAEQEGMLSQRIVKAYCQLALNIAPELARHLLAQSIRDFEDNLKLLEKAAGTRRTQSPLADLRSAWEVMHPGPLEEFTPSGAEQLDRRAEAVLQAAERLNAELQDQAPAVANRWGNTAARQRMLSQRLGKAYMLRQLGLDSASTRQELESASHEFSGALSGLQKRVENSPAVRTALDDLATQWEWLHEALAVEGASDYRLIVAEGSEVILELADKVTALYSNGQ
jgi:hypothetical protein